MTTGEKTEQKNNNLLQLRSCMGTWVSPKSSNGNTVGVTIAERDVTPQEDLRQFTITEHRGSYKPALVYNITLAEVKAKIKAMQQNKYVLSKPTYPELLQFFRNGNPITYANILEDSLREIKTEENPQLDGIAYLMENWK